MNTAPSPQLPVLYRQVTVLDRNQHRGLKLRREPLLLARAAGEQVLPALFEEFAAAARHLPILFAPGPKQPSPVFLLGAAPGRNAFVDLAAGRWTSEYAPAYLRRFPFILGDRPDADPVVLVDASYEGFSETEGEALFDGEGAPTAVLNEMIRLSDEYRKAALRSEELVGRLARLDLFRQVNLDIRPAEGGAPTSVQGLLIVDEAKLNALPDADFLSLRANGLLGAVHAHLLSLAGVGTLARSIPAA